MTPAQEVALSFGLGVLVCMFLCLCFCPDKKRSNEGSNEERTPLLFAKNPAFNPVITGCDDEKKSSHSNNP